MQTKSNKKHIFGIIAGMVIAGVLLAIVSAHSLRAESDVTVGVTVVGAPLTIGATILNPTNQQVFTETDTITVSGTCSPSAYVIIQSGSSAIGSTVCQQDGTFSLAVQPFPGQNVLTAYNYDDLNAAGPNTPSVTITYTPPAPPVTPTAPVRSSTPVSAPPAVNIPGNPSVVPGTPPTLPGLTETDSSCDNYTAPQAAAGGQVRLAIVCLPRLISTHAKILVGLLIYGGSPPYTITLNWGDSVQSSYTADMPGYHTFAALYDTAGTFTLNAKAIDASGNQAINQAAIRVTGDTTTAVSTAPKVPWYRSSSFWEVATVIGLFIFVIILIIYYVRRAS